MQEKVPMYFGELIKFGIRDFGMSIALRAGVAAEYDAYVFDKTVFNQKTPYIINDNMGEDEVRAKLKELIDSKLRKYLTAELDKYGAESKENVLTSEIKGKLENDLEKLGVKLTECTVVSVKMPENDPLYIKYKELKNLKKPSEAEILKQRDESYKKLQTSVNKMMDNLEPNLARFMKLKTIYESGFITEAEFECKKAEILKNM